MIFDTQEYLNGDFTGNSNAVHSADLELPITTWDYAPQLKIKARLAQSASEGNSSAVTVFSRQNEARQVQGQDNGYGSAEVELPQATDLTPSEEVIIKDVWNKLRAWKELQMEKFLKRLLLEIQPETQVIVGEPLMGVPPAKGDGLDTVEDYGSFFAGIGLRPRHWLKAREVWIWMLLSIPYLEDYDREDLHKAQILLSTSFSTPPSFCR